MKIYSVFLLIFFLSEAIGTTHADASKPYPGYTETCIALSRDSNIGAIAVTSCHPDYAAGPEADDWERSVRDTCMLASDDYLRVSNPEELSFVTGISTRTTFHNKYCVECNHAKGTEAFGFWNTVLHCESLLPLGVKDSYVRKHLEFRSRKWGVVIRGHFHQCDLSYEKPDSLDVIQCHVKPSMMCPSPWRRNMAVIEACSSCMNSTSNNPLRNYHCRICIREPDTVRECGFRNN